MCYGVKMAIQLVQRKVVFKSMSCRLMLTGCTEISSTRKWHTKGAKREFKKDSECDNQTTAALRGGLVPS